ncbi:MAG: hypothetical protein WDZ61_00215 [Parcubacteria group bacterium]
MSTTKKVLGLDFDDVLIDFNVCADDWHNRTYGTNFQTRDRKVFANLDKNWSCTPAQAVERVFEFYRSDDHYHAPPINGAVEALRTLKHKHTLVLVTSRAEEIRAHTMRWIDRHFEGFLDHVCLTNQYGGKANKRTKAEVCREHGVEVFIDDHLEYAEDVASNGTRVLLFDQPWNKREQLAENIQRVHSWDEIVGVLG